MTAVPSSTGSVPSPSSNPEPERVGGGDALHLSERFGIALAQAGRLRRHAAPGDEEGGSGQGMTTAFGAAQHHGAAPDAVASAPSLSAVEFAATLERLQAPVPGAASAGQWEFGLDPLHAPLLAVRVAEHQQGGWNVTLVATPRDRAALQSHLDRLRLRLVGRGSAVTDLTVDDAER